MSSKNMQNSKEMLDIIKRIKEIKGLYTDVQVAKTLKMTRNNLYSFKSRGKIPHEALQSFCLKEGVRLDYLLNGALPIYDQPKQFVAESQEKYPVAQKRRVTDNIPLKISDLLTKTSYILESDTPHKFAFVGMIEACYSAVMNEERIAEKERTIKRLEDELKTAAGGLPPAASG